MSDGVLKGELSRREAIKTTLKAGAYVAPVVLSSVVPAAVSAASPPGPVCTFPTTIVTPIIYSGAIPSTLYDIYMTPGTTPPATFPPPATSATSDARGIAVFANLSYTASTPATIPFLITIVRRGGSTASPALQNVQNFTSFVTCTPGGPPAAANMLPLIAAEPTTANCTGTAPGQYTISGPVAVFNLQPNMQYDVYAQPNNVTPAGTFLKLGMLATNATGNGGLPVVGGGPFTIQGGGAPTAVLINVVPVGAAAQSAVVTFTATLANNRLFVLTCALA